MDETDAVALTRARKWVATGLAAEVREAAGLSLREVASAVGVASPATPSRWERGERKPRGVAGARYGRLLFELLWGRQ